MSAFRNCFPGALESEDRIPIVLGKSFIEGGKQKRCLVEITNDLKEDIEVSNVNTTDSTAELTVEDKETPAKILKGIKRRKEGNNTNTTTCVLIFNKEANSFTLEKVDDIVKLEEVTTSG